MAERRICRYDWDDSEEVGKIAVEQVTDCLMSPAVSFTWAEGCEIQNVEADKRYRELVIDLLWYARVEGSVRCISVEVKGDRHPPRNFFLETISDIKRSTPGCFVKCQADWYCYYFIKHQVLYCIPTKSAQKWFLENELRFVEMPTSTQCDGRIWHTKGRLVRVKSLLNEVGGVKEFSFDNGFWIPRNLLCRVGRTIKRPDSASNAA